MFSIIINKCISVRRQVEIRSLHGCLGLITRPLYDRWDNLLSMEPWAAAKKVSVSVSVPPAPVRVPSQRPLAPSVASVSSVPNDKGDNEMILGAVNRSPDICLKLRKTPENLS